MSSLGVSIDFCTTVLTSQARDEWELDVCRTGIPNAAHNKAVSTSPVWTSIKEEWVSG